MPFRIALSGLNAAQSDLNVTANNIANTSTNGFKGSRTEFADLFAVSLQGVSSNATGNGVRVAAVAQQFAQGNIEFTDSNLDLAVSGQGMFIARRTGRAGLYARRRLPDESRRLRGQLAGQRLQVYPPLGGRRLQHRRSLRSAPADHRLRRRQATANVEYVLNLPASATPPPVATVRSDRSEFLQPGDVAHAVRFAGRDAHRHDVLRQDARTPTSGPRSSAIDGTPVGGAADPAVLQHRPADRAGRRPARLSRLHTDHRCRRTWQSPWTCRSRRSSATTSR